MYGGQMVASSRPLGAPLAPGWMPNGPSIPGPMIGGNVMEYPSATKQQRHRSRHHKHTTDKKSKGGLFSCFQNPTRGKRSTKVRLMERTGMAVEIDSADEDDWDAPMVNNKVWGDRRGPMRERPVDDLMITLQDLFPCCAPLFEICGCIKRKPRRMLPGKQLDRNIGGPKLETVCLDCGHIIDAKNIPRTVAIDMFDRHNGLHHQAFTQGVAIGEDDSPVTQGIWDQYNNWTVAGAHSRHGGDRAVSYVPLPRFNEAPARVFLNSPLDDTIRPTTDLPEINQ